jgi:hypothetical protein
VTCVPSGDREQARIKGPRDAPAYINKTHHVDGFTRRYTVPLSKKAGIPEPVSTSRRSTADPDSSVVGPKSESIDTPVVAPMDVDSKDIPPGKTSSIAGKSKPAPKGKGRASKKSVTETARVTRSSAKTNTAAPSELDLDRKDLGAAEYHAEATVAVQMNNYRLQRSLYGSSSAARRRGNRLAIAAPEFHGDLLRMMQEQQQQQQQLLQRMKKVESWTSGVTDALTALQTVMQGNNQQQLSHFESLNQQQLSHFESLHEEVAGVASAVHGVASPTSRVHQPE